MRRRALGRLRRRAVDVFLQRYKGKVLGCGFDGGDGEVPMAAVTGADRRDCLSHKGPARLAILTSERRPEVGAAGRRLAPRVGGGRIVAVGLVAVLALGLLVPPALAHIMSMSSGELRVEGTHATYVLRMPLYEITHLEKPEPTLLKSFRLFAGGEEIPLKYGACRADGEGIYRCETSYVFPEPPDEVTVECTFAAVTVPNHVHVLRAIRGDVTEQAVFDFSTSRATIRFTPPTWSELATSQMWAGVVRVLMGPFQVLFLVALVLAGRERRELVWLAVSFAAAEAFSAAMLAGISWGPPPRFVEAAAALTVAYLAVEILVLPDAGYRWMIAAGMGVFHGFYFGSFLKQSEMDSLYVLGGVLLANALLLGVFAYLLARLREGAAWLRPLKSGAVVLFVIGFVWFVMRVRS
jgi:hydrogenase/urease accessory protein HupE